MFVFITVDPRRDTPSRLKSYLGEFSSNLVGLTGKPKNVLDVLAAYGVYRNRRADGAIDHSAIALLIDARGILSGRIEENQLGSDVALSKLRRLIAMSGHGATKEKKRSG
jgi:protein SCO1/2